MRHTRLVDGRQAADEWVSGRSRFRKESAKGISLRRMEAGRTPSNMMTAVEDVGGADLVLQNNVSGT